MIKHLQDLANKNKLHIVSLILQLFFKQYIKIFSWSFNIKLSKSNRMNIQKSRRIIVDLKSTINQFNITKIYTISCNSWIQILFKFP